ncbi:6,7-dimethyl-8-ribityllumazine synthase [Rhabdothermincola salaria]|uniref:6,7-dimethyl-8-ribityllumazine synthase n=1 Tax=Rhabdothermincola salaria TaxID=2903142 RepID=UPI001E505756|nr:6,7-dimethyl-8-ribityllumazine synthase [Rhabdothermincola salaria]MCD9623172.1 6,7-dimethyl-8-ribityllumazine synthase [Rhabdothermincola salaria]
MSTNFRSANAVTGEVDGSGVRIGLVLGRFNDHITERLLEGAENALAVHGVAEADVTVVWVPGAFEIPLAAKALVVHGHVDAVVCLGAVIRGETSHYDFVAGECARGIQDVQLETGVPVVFGVLTTENLEQALARSAEDDNKGEESVRTALEMVSLLGQLGS